MNYQNPIITGFYPDPSIVRVENDYYLVNSSFEYLPGVPLFHSTDLVNWNQISYVLNRESQIDLHETMDSGGIFAPTIRYHDGVFYMITTNLYKGNFIVTTTNPLEGWSDPIFIKDAPGIDPSLLFDDGKVYMQYSCLSNGMWQGVLDVTTGEFIGEQKMISMGCGGRDPEAPHMYKKGEYYYLMNAEGGTREGHMITLQRSKSIWGPFEPCPHNPILTNRNAKGETLQAVGHGDLFEDASGDWWIVALAHREKKHKHVLGRETILVPVEWENDWIVVKDGYAPSIVETHRTINEQNIVALFHDEFINNQLSLEWITLRDFLKNQYHINDGKLFLKANEYTLSDNKKYPCFVATRQKGWIGKWEVSITDSPEQGECGVSLYADHEHHIDFVIETNTNGDKRLFVRKCVGDIEHIGKQIDISYIKETKEIKLLIESDNQYYKFYYMDKDNNKIEVDYTLCKHLATEVITSMFTGVVCGVFVYGDKKEIAVNKYNYDYDPYS